jgi:hypothetical protein
MKWRTAAATVTSKVSATTATLCCIRICSAAVCKICWLRAHTARRQPLCGERFRRGTANPLTRGCDQRDSTFQSKIHEGEL